MTASMREIGCHVPALLAGAVFCCATFAAPPARAQVQNGELQSASSGQPHAPQDQRRSGQAASPVPGDTADVTASAAPSGELAEIFVTAEKRREDLLNVPASITAITSSDMANQHIQTIDDITRNVPGLSFSTQSGNGASVGVGSENIAIRGVGSAVGAATVGMYIDDVPITQLIQAGTFVPMMFDLQRIEVLRGPQGTLYGASSEGGTVRFITQPPDLAKVDAMVSANISNTLDAGANTDEKGMLNVPVIDGKLAVRGDAEYLHNSGWIDRYAHAPTDPTTATSTLLQKDVNGEDDRMVRLAAKYQPDESLSITPFVMYQEQHQDDSPAYFLNAGRYRQANAVAESAGDKGTVGSVTINKQWNFANLTSVTSYFNRRFDRARDGTFFDSNYIVCCFLDSDPRTAAEQPVADSTLGVLPVTVVDDDHVHSVTQELRLASAPIEAGRRSLSWLIGAYFSANVDNQVHDELAPGWNALFQSIYGFSVNNPVLSPISDPTNPNLWQNNFYHLTTQTQARQAAVFGQLSYQLLKRVTATIGLRYQESNLTFSYHGSGFYDIGISDINDAHARDVAVTPKFALRYAITQDANVYVSAAKGYRDAGFNLPIPEAVCGPDESQVGLKGSAPRFYGPDHLWSYELGSKAMLAKRHLSISADVYDIEWNNIQQQIVIPGCFFDFTSNVGSARAYGSELELAYRPSFIDGLTVGLAGSVEHATITSTSAFTVAAVGDHLLFTPEWTGSVTAAYTKPISDSLTLSVRAQNSWQGKSYGDFLSNQTDYVNREYGQLNGSVGLIIAGGLEVQVFGKNLLNNATVLREPTIAGVTEAYTLPPRILGIEATKTF